jgi:hypothetical protein
MKRYALPLALAFISVAFAAFAAWPEAGKIRLTNGSMLGYDQASATWRPIAVGTNGAIPIEGTVTIGTATVNPDTPPTANSMTAVSVTASAANVANLLGEP